MKLDQAIYNDVREFSNNRQAVRTTATALKFPSMERKTIPQKATLAAHVSIHLHEFVKKKNINSHFVERIGECDQKVLVSDPLPFNLVIRNKPTTDFVAEFGEELCEHFEAPLTEYFITPSEEDPRPIRVSDDHLIAFDLVEDEDYLEEIVENEFFFQNFIFHLFSFRTDWKRPGDGLQ